MTTAEILERFSNVKKTGSGWLARCPSHDDRVASASIGEGEGGRILLKCHAGCETKDILSALGLVEADLFPAKDKPKPEIVATYSYRDEAGTVLYEAVRFAPKDFRQRRPDGAGWAWNLAGVRRVLYRLRELQGHAAALVTEGEKDADALAALDLPATTNAGGAGKWIESYTEQLKRQGVQRIAVLPDNDEPGRLHAEAIARSCYDAHVDARVVVLPGLPPKGDVSDWLAAGGTKAELLKLVRETPIWRPSAPAAPSRDFLTVSDYRCTLTIRPEHIILDLDRIHRTHHDLVGELSVTVNGCCPDAKHIDGVISTADLNLSSAQARATRAKLLAERSGNADLDWFGYIEELCVRTMRSQRDGGPSESLADGLPDEEEMDDSLDVLEVQGFPLLRDHPTVIFGDPAAAKSYVAIWFAGELAKIFPVLYCDWELDKGQHQKRAWRLFGQIPRDLRYVRCVNPLVDEADRIRRLIKTDGIRFLVFDSIGPACNGRPEEAEHANAYMRQVRAFGIGSLHLAHTSKQDSRDEGGKNDQRIYGSQFFTANARSIWFIQRAENNPDGQIRFGLYERKNSFGQDKRTRAYTLHFEGRRSRFESGNVADTEELAAKLPILDRIKRALNGVALTPKAISEDIGAPPNAVRTMLSRHRKLFTKLGDGKYGLAVPSMDF